MLCDVKYNKNSILTNNSLLDYIPNAVIPIILSLENASTGKSLNPLLTASATTDYYTGPTSATKPTIETTTIKLST